ncbi:unnamed protein product [Nezara viridula]|uniref:Uncharacterized protein n=1 Tax=Nezara viridula TaxID=85310 RepID=A0A9P0E7G7_NEZVI|nr:unnamed protein product [Nezara viridula]
MAMKTVMNLLSLALYDYSYMGGISLRHLDIGGTHPLCMPQESFPTPWSLHGQ